MAWPRSESATILSKIRRCASRKKSSASIISAARLNASLCSRIAPSTERSASRLCGSVRSATATSAMLRLRLLGLAFGRHDQLDRGGDVALQTDRDAELAGPLDRFLQL